MTLSDRDGDFKFIVCRISNVSHEEGEAMYEVRQLFGNETYEIVNDRMDGSIVTVFRRDGEIVDTAGEFCGEFIDRGQARIQASRLQKLAEVMES